VKCLLLGREERRGAENVFRQLISMWKIAVHLGWSPMKVSLLFLFRMTWKPFLSNSLLNTLVSSILITSMGSPRILRYVSKLKINFQKPDSYEDFL